MKLLRSKLQVLLLKKYSPPTPSFLWYFDQKDFYHTIYAIYCTALLAVSHEQLSFHRKQPHVSLLIIFEKLSNLWWWFGIWKKQAKEDCNAEKAFYVKRIIGKGRFISQQRPSSSRMFVSCEMRSRCLLTRDKVKRLKGYHMSSAQYNKSSLTTT